MQATLFLVFILLASMPSLSSARDPTKQKAIGPPSGAIRCFRIVEVQEKATLEGYNTDIKEKTHAFTIFYPEGKTYLYLSADTTKKEAAKAISDFLSGKSGLYVVELQVILEGLGKERIRDLQRCWPVGINYFDDKDQLVGGDSVVVRDPPAPGRRSSVRIPIPERFLGSFYRVFMPGIMPKF